MKTAAGGGGGVLSDRTSGGPTALRVPGEFVTAGQSVSATTKRRTAANKGSKSPKRSNAGRSRKLVVSVSLLMVLGLTSALLLALAPAPLAPGAASSLFAVEPPKSLDVIFETAAPLKAGRWSHIYVHHSQTLSGSAATLGVAGPGGVADHFVIGNGDGCADGELQIAQRWNHQQSAGPLPGVSQMDPSCISICLVGDFNRTHPTRTQMRRLAQLVSALQARLSVPAEQVWVIDGVAGPGGVGRYFPAAEFRKELLP